MPYRTKEEFCTSVEHYLRIRLEPPTLAHADMEGLPQYLAAIQALPASERASFATKELRRLEKEIALAEAQERRWQSFLEGWATEFSDWVLKHTSIVEIDAWSYSQEKELVGTDEDAEQQLAKISEKLSPNTPIPKNLLPVGTSNPLFKEIAWDGFWLLEANNETMIEFARVGVVVGSTLRTHSLPEFLEMLYLGHWQVFENKKIQMPLLMEQKAIVEQELRLWGEAVSDPEPPEMQKEPTAAFVIGTKFGRVALDRELLNESYSRKHPIKWFKPELAAPLFEALKRENYLAIENLELAIQYHGGAGKQERIKLGNRLLWIGVKSDLIHLQQALHDSNIWSDKNLNKVLEQNFAFLSEDGNEVQLTLETNFSDLRSKLKNEHSWGDEQKIRSLVASLPRV